MSKPISFTEFLKEGALLKEKAPVQTVAKTEAPKPFRIEPEEAASESEQRKFWKQLRHFFRTGEVHLTQKGVFVPALIAPYLQSKSWDVEYPFYLSDTLNASIDRLSLDAFNACFKDGEARILKENRLRWLNSISESLAAHQGFAPFDTLKQEATNKLLALEVHGELGEKFRDDIARWSAAMPDHGFVAEFSNELPLQLLKFKLDQIALKRQAFKVSMKKTLGGLKELYKLITSTEQQRDGSSEGYDFADDLIAIGMVNEMLPRAGIVPIDTGRIERIHKTIEILESTLKASEKEAHLLVEDSMKGAYDWDRIFTSCKVSHCEMPKALEDAGLKFDQNIGAFTEVLVAMRIAQLELDGKYNPDVHDDFFNHFKWFKLNPDELALFPPVVVITTGEALLKNSMGQLSQLFAKDKPIRVLAFTNRITSPIDPNIDWEDASHTYRQELAAFSLSHRGVHTLQCATDKPEPLLKGMSAALAVNSPSFMHLLIPEANESPRIAFLKINAASAGRHFPYISYDCSRGSAWGSRFDVSNNPQLLEDWPAYPFVHLRTDGLEEQASLKFTYADYKAMTQSKVDELMFVPEKFTTPDLIPVHEYMALPQQETTGKVPFIWLVDEDNRMHRAAIPYMWVVSCIERLDFWNFIRDLGGVNSYHVSRALSEARNQWESEKQEELKQLREAFDAELNKVRNEAASTAMEQLASALLGTDFTATASSPKAKSKSSPEVKEAKEPDTQEEEEIPVIAVSDNGASTVPAEAYIDSFKCTSCNDCIEKYPAIFTYNEDKQAVVKDASKGTFAQLVDAAENCPAACIHPGAPLNTKEADLESLIARAAKFNQ